MATPTDVLFLEIDAGDKHLILDWDLGYDEGE